MARRITLAALGLCLLEIIYRSLSMAGAVHNLAGFIDFDVFLAASRMILHGQLLQAYDVASMVPLQAPQGGQTFLSWPYPPQFDLIVAPLALIPAWAAYALFIGATLVAFVFVLHTLSGPGIGFALLIVYPGILVAISSGQNGLLTGALTGLICLGLLHGRLLRSGIALGLMVIKPHLAIGLALYTLGARRWVVMLAAAATVALSGGLATLAFGPAVWGAFLHGASVAGRGLSAGAYPLFRMVSCYALLRSLGASLIVAWIAHAAAAGLATAGVALAWRRGLPRNCIVALALLAGLVASPYVYDYDLPVAAVAFAVLAPHLLRLATRRELAVMFALGWFAPGWGLVQEDLVYARSGAQAIARGPALGAAAFLLLLIMVWRVLQREQTPSRQAESPTTATFQAA
jgi:hypothetical protein